LHLQNLGADPLDGIDELAMALWEPTGLNEGQANRSPGGMSFDV
jgi:hypothetical protein